MGIFQDRMERALLLGDYSDRTRRTYLSCMRHLVAYFMRPPDTLSREDLHRFQLHLIEERKLSRSWVNCHVCALKFFYSRVVPRDWPIRHLPCRRRGRGKRLPEVFSRDEVRALIEAAPTAQYRTLFMTFYATGLRLHEGIRLRPEHIDSRRMVVRVSDGKGGRDRLTLLSPRLLEALRQHWASHRHATWLFPGKHPEHHVSPRAVQRAFQRARKAAGIRRRSGCHTLRHSFATHLREAGVDMEIIQRLLGHHSPSTTLIYARLAGDYLETTTSPLDHLQLG